MAENSSIEWTDATWNAVTGCTKVSPGCANCYIERTPPFRMNGRKFVKGEIPLVFHDDRLTAPLRWRKPRRVFVNSLSDLFHEDVPFEFVDRVFAVMALTPQHTYQLLTKRPERMREYVSASALPPPDPRMRPIHRGSKVLWAGQEMADRGQLPKGMSYPWSDEFVNGEPLDWPLPNVWLGTSVENQRWADVRIPELLATPAAVRFLSCEPLLGPLDLRPYMGCEVCAKPLPCSCGYHEEPGLDLVITGGESGPGDIRSSDIAWFRSLRDQCRAAGVAFFMKQLGGKSNRCPHSSKGGCFDCFPDDLKVREMPR